MDILWVFLAAVLGYLLGSVNAAVIIVKLLRGQDIRSMGSGNAGATNVVRNVGKGAGAATLLFDLTKGMIAAGIGWWLVGSAGGNPLLGAFAGGLAAVVGHVLPLYHGFRGGKGLITAAGTVAVIDPQVFLPLLAVFIAAFLISRMVSLGAVTVAALMPLACYWVHRGAENFAIYFVFECIFTAIILFMHRANIGRLAKGTEYRFEFKRKKK